MANIGTTDFYIGVPSLPREEFEEYSTRLFDEWEIHVGSTLALPDYSLTLEVEEGSIKAVGKIAATLGALYIGIGQYSSFISGLQTIHSQVRSVGDYLGERAGSPFELSNTKSKVRKRGESLAKLQSLFNKVQHGAITVEEAMRESEIIFGSEAEEAPEFMNVLKEALEQIPLFPEQMQLPLVDINGEGLIQDGKKQTKPRPSQPRKPVPIPEQYRVEVWRENRKGKRNVRVRSL